MRKSFFLGVLLLSFLAVSCSKEQRYADSIWACEYPIQMLNNTTKEYEDHIGTMQVIFSSDISTAQIMTSVAGMYAANMILCDATWNKDKTSFYLSVPVDSSNGYNYSGNISGKTMLLKNLKSNTERELTRVK